MDKPSIKSPISWVPTLYFAMGVPFVALSLVSVLMFSDLGISDAKIAFWSSLIILPYTLKPLWSPLLELYKTKKFFVILTQLITAISFVLIALSLPLPSFFNYAIALMGVMAFSGATHDIAADGVYMQELNTEQQAKYIGWQGAFYNLAKIITNGALVFLAGSLSDQYGALKAWMIMMAICGVMMLLLAIYHVSFLPSTAQNPANQHLQPEDTLSGGIKEVIVSFFKKKHVIYYILFIIFYRFAEGYAMKIAPLFLKAPISGGGLGLSTQDIGLLYGTFGTAAFIIGSLSSGYFIASQGLKKVILPLVAIFNIPFAVYLLLAIFQPTQLGLIGAGIVLEYFGYGFGFVGLTLYMMQEVAAGEHKMAHYAFATGIMNLGVMIPGMMSGLLSDTLGYKNFFIWVMIATIPIFILTLKLPFTSLENTTKS